MVFKTSFKLLVAIGTTPFFAVVSLIFAQHCSTILDDLYDYNYNGAQPEEESDKL